MGTGSVRVISWPALVVIATLSAVLGLFAGVGPRSGSPGTPGAASAFSARAESVDRVGGRSTRPSSGTAWQTARTISLPVLIADDGSQREPLLGPELPVVLTPPGPLGRVVPSPEMRDPRSAWSTPGSSRGPPIW